MTIVEVRIATLVLLVASFYRAMLAHSAVMRLRVVCLSVCPSLSDVTFRYGKTYYQSRPD